MNKGHKNLTHQILWASKSANCRIPRRIRASRDGFVKTSKAVRYGESPEDIQPTSNQRVFSRWVQTCPKYNFLNTICPKATENVTSSLSDNIYCKLAKDNTVWAKLVFVITIICIISNSWEDLDLNPLAHCLDKLIKVFKDVVTDFK